MIRWSLLAAPLALASCDPTRTEAAPIEYVARLLYPSSEGCPSAVDSQTVSWPDCHAFLGHVHADGTPVVDDAPVAAYRPVRAYVNLRYLRTSVSGELVVCDERTVQTDANGNLRVPLTPCGRDGARLVAGRAYLQYAIQNADHSRRGFVRTLWEADRADDLFALTADDEVQQGFGFDVDLDDGTVISYAVPQLAFVTTLSDDEEVGTVAEPAIINGGTRVFLSSPDDDSFGYMRQVLSAHGTVVALHERLLAELTAAGREDEYFDQMFVNDAEYRSLLSYTVYLNANWAFASRGYMALYRPDIDVFTVDGDGDGEPDGAASATRLLSAVGTLAHEFGHSTHGAFASQSSRWDYAYANGMRNLSATFYDWGHGGEQVQEMGVAFGEGLASSMGQGLVNTCRGSVGARRPTALVSGWARGMWSGDTSCDTDEFTACPAHHSRFQFMANGMANGSDAYNARLQRLQDLTADAEAAGALSWVSSSSEFRYGEFGCDLLDADPSIEHARSTAGVPYVENFNYLAGLVFQGGDPPLTLNTYGGEPGPELVEITLPELLDVMATVCPSCPSLTNDLQDPAYLETRVRALGGSEQSPQSLSAALVARGWATDGQVDDLLQSNFMELPE